MRKKVLIISSSMRNKSNSEKLAEQFAKGAEEVGNKVLQEEDIETILKQSM